MHLIRTPELTFIVVARPIADEDDNLEFELTNEHITELPMIGDVNLFFKNRRDDPEFEVECEVMIAGALLYNPPIPAPLSSSFAR